MNWLAKYGTPVLVILFFISCRSKDGQITVGTNYSTIGANFSDTLSLNTYTVLTDDSVATSLRVTYAGSSTTTTTSCLQIGHYADSETGDVRAEAYTQLRLATENVDFSDVSSVANIDSARLYLDYYGYSCGDSTASQYFQVYEMTSALDPAGVYFSSSPAPSLGSLIGTSPTLQINARTKIISGADKLNPVLTIPIDNNWAYGIIAAGGTTSDNFVATVLDGIAIIPGPGPAGVVTRVNFNSNTRLVIYYNHTKTYTLTISTNGQGFSRITADRSPTIYSSLVTKVSKPASATNEITYTHAGVGVRTKVEIPYLNLFKEAVGHNVVINKALLVMPVPPASIVNHQQSSGIYLIRTSANNFFSYNAHGGVAVVQTTNHPQNGTGYDLIVGYDATNNYYQADITDYVRDMLNQRLPNTGFFLYPFFNERTSSRTLFYSGSLTNTNRMTLKLYYTIKP